MSSGYRMGWEPGTRLERRAVHFMGSGSAALVLMAAIPAALGMLQQAIFGISTRAVAIGGENVAATAFVLGNQLQKPALAKNAGAMVGAKGGVLALCSGTSGESPGVRLECSRLASTTQR